VEPISPASRNRLRQFQTESLPARAFSRRIVLELAGCRYLGTIQSMAGSVLARPQPRRRALDQTLRSTVMEKHDDEADRHSDGFSIYREGGRLLQIHPAVSLLKGKVMICSLP
jgi:hypothetical protein